MTQRTYRTAQGKVVDLGALQLKNENVRAVGNMAVNARGDQLDSYNRSIDSRNSQVAKQYRKQETNVHDDAVVSSKKQLDAAPARPVAKQTVAVPETTPETKPVESVNTGLAAAIARARQVKQVPKETNANLTRRESGVKKI